MNTFFSLIAAIMLLCSCTKVPPGYAGIVVNQYGSQRGVEDFPIKTGAVWFNPFTEDVFTFPTFRQNVIWDQADDDESLTFNSIEGSVINADCSLSYSIDADKVPHIFVEFRKGIEDITHIYLRSEVRDAMAKEASHRKVIDIFGAQKQEMLDAVKKDLQTKLSPLGFQFEMISFVGGLRPKDQNVMDSINATITATQLAISAQNKVLQAKAEADQAIETARGQAESLLAVARAQAEANKVVAASLTPELVQWKSLERWNGVTPQFMGGGAALPLITVPLK